MKEPSLDSQKQTSEVLSLPKNENEFRAMDTSTIIRCMVGLQKGYGGPFSNVPMEEQQKQFGLLSLELDKRIEEFQIPNEILDATRAYMFHPKNETEEESNQRQKQYHSVSGGDWWRYTIAALICSAELHINSRRKEERIKEARNLIRRYLRVQAGVPEYYEA